MKRAITMCTAAAAMLFAGFSAQAATVKGVAVKGPVVPGRAVPTTVGGASGLTITGIAVGTSGFAPCFNCAGGGDVDLPYLQDAIPAGSPITTTIMMQDTFYSGAPTVYYALLQGGKVVSSSSVAFPFELTPDEEALAYFPDTAPATTGSATIVMETYTGATLIGTNTYNIYIY